MLPLSPLLASLPPLLSCSPAHGIAAAIAPPLPVFGMAAALQMSLSTLRQSCDCQGCFVTAGGAASRATGACRMRHGACSLSGDVSTVHCGWLCAAAGACGTRAALHQLGTAVTAYARPVSVFLLRCSHSTGDLPCEYGLEIKILIMRLLSSSHAACRCCLALQPPAMGLGWRPSPRRLLRCTASASKGLAGPPRYLCSTLMQGQLHSGVAAAGGNQVCTCKLKKSTQQSEYISVSDPEMLLDSHQHHMERSSV